MEPGGDLAGRPAGGAAPGARLLRERGRRGGEDDEPAAEELHELAAIDLEPVRGPGGELVPLRLERGAVLAARPAAHPPPPFVASAARRTARTMRSYVPHRQMWPSRAWAISGAAGSGLRRRSATASMIMPGVQ